MLLLSTSSLRWYGLHKIFYFAKEAKYGGLNLDLSFLDFDTENPTYISSLIKEYGIPVVSITTHERRMTSELVDSIMEMATTLGTKIVNFYPPHRLDKDGDWFSDYLPKVTQRKKDKDVTIINVQPKTFLFFIPEYRDATLPLIKKVTGLTALNVSNVEPESGTDLIKTFSILWNSIRNVYLSDKSGNKEDLMLWKGDMPLESLLIKLQDGGYNGYFTLKISPKELWVGDDAVVLKNLEDSKKYIEKHFTPASS